MIVAKFDLKTLQLNTVNSFVYADLDKTVFMKMLLGYSKKNRVFKLNRVLYSLCQSFLLC